MDIGLLSWATSVLFVVLSVECAAFVDGPCEGTGLRTWGNSPTSISAGSSTGAAGDGIADGVLVACARAEVTRVASASTRVLARGIWLFQRGKEVDVGVRGRGPYLVRGAAAGFACLSSLLRLQTALANNVKEQHIRSRERETKYCCEETQ